MTSHTDNSEIEAMENSADSDSQLETDNTQFGQSVTQQATPTADPVPQHNSQFNQGFIGRVIDDRYRILRLLGEGGMGAVFVAEHLKLHKRVALKIVRAELAGNGEVAVRFAREAMATAQFEHPSVASAIDYGTLQEGGAYFVMQLVRGKSLAQILRKENRLHWERVCALAAQVADALTAAEEAGIVHRDLKPENIMVESRKDGSELVKILDFGIAHVPKTDAPAPAGAMATRELTKLGAVMGTPGYMAPEQAVGERADHRTDLYALGVVLWECIVGRPLWDETEITTLFTRQLGEPVPSMKKTASDPTIPNPLEDLVMKLLQRSPNDRPEHSIEVRDKLREVSQHSLSPKTQFAHQLDSLLLYVSPLSDRISSWKTAWQKQSKSYKQRQMVIASLVLLLLTVTITVGIAGGESETTQEQTSGEQAEPVKAITEVAKAIVEKVAPEEPSIPPEIEKEIHTMNDGARVRERRAAAKKVLAFEPSTAIAPYLLNIAALEAARGCRARKDAIEQLRKAGEKKTLNALRRLSRMSKSGCGFLGLEDCYGCIRSDLRRAIQEIEDNAFGQ